MHGRESLQCSHIKHTLCTEGGSRVQSHQTHTVHRGRIWSAVTSNTHCAQRVDLECSHIKHTLCTHCVHTQRGLITRVKWKRQLHSYTKLGNRIVCRNQSLQHFHTELWIKGHSTLQWSAIDCFPLKCGRGYPGSLCADQLWGDTQRKPQTNTATHIIYHRKTII